MTFFDLFRTRQPALIRQALQDLKGMLETAQTMFGAAAAHLLDNEPLPFDLEDRDQTINDGEQNVRRAVLEHIAIDPEHDMVFSLTLLSIVQDAERLGDLAKSLAETAELAQAPRMGERAARLRATRDHVAAMFETTRRAFLDGDEAGARAVMEESRTAKEQVATFIKRLAASDDVSANEALVLGLAARFIGRTSSHLSNIASSVALPFDQIRSNDESI